MRELNYVLLMIRTNKNADSASHNLINVGVNRDSSCLLNIVYYKF